MCHAGEKEATANWVMELHLTKPRPRLPAALVRVARLWRSLLEVTTPAPSSTTVMCRAGDADLPANWVMEENLNKTLPRLPAALVRATRP